MTSGGAATIFGLLLSSTIQDGEQFVLEYALEFRGVANLLAVHLFAHGRQHFARGGRAEVGGDEGGFQVVQRPGVDFLAEADDLVDALGKIFTGARDRLLHPLKER